MNIIKSVNEFVRNLENTNRPNDGSRTLLESILVPEVGLAFNDWVSNDIKNCVLIGGLALSYYIKPRTTTDMDVLFIKSEDVPLSVNKFKKHRNLAFQHNLTHVEVEVLTPKSINVPTSVAQIVFNTAVVKNNIKIASPSGLVALKLFRFNRQDQADIENLIECTDIDLTPFDLSKEMIEKYEEIKKDIK